ncbi:hypothetical protein Glove_9g174 [Diversispora epigaea]|uniref:Uncharacterized protein n=1 Tax=Diversispora epigaea TaxID=1348612 RepID=A0A397JXC1_9GLOM|nr:hypothetical protein Glove_9g174 [Diversispora epigaea]
MWELLFTYKLWNKDDFLTLKLLCNNDYRILDKISLNSRERTIISNEHAAEISSWIDHKIPTYSSTNYPYEFHPILRIYRLLEHVLNNNIYMHTNDSFIFSLKNDNIQNSFLQGGQIPIWICPSQTINLCGCGDYNYYNYHEKRQFSIDDDYEVFKKLPKKYQF